MKQDVEKIVQECINYIVTTVSDRVPRPMSNALQGQNLNELVNIDILYIVRAKGDNYTYGMII